MSTSVDELVGKSAAVIFDFDGPLCRVFSGLPAPLIAKNLQDQFGILIKSDDPLDVLRKAGLVSLTSAQAVDTALTTAEIEAVRCSTPTPGGLEAIGQCNYLGLQVGIVSNNSFSSIVEFLKIHGVIDLVGTVVGRTLGRPDLMKPDAWPMKSALNSLHLSPDEVVFIGDTVTDIQVARLTRVPCIAFATNGSKVDSLANAGAKTIVRDMHEVVDALKRRR